MQTLTMPMPDYLQIHLRDADLLATTVPHCAHFCTHAKAMPNLHPLEINEKKYLCKKILGLYLPIITLEILALFLSMQTRQ